MGGGGGSRNQVQQQVVTQSNIPDYARHYFEDLMTREQAALNEQYQPYRQERIADFTQDQRTVQNNILNQQRAGQFATGTNLTATAGQRALEQSAYTTGQFNPNTVSYQQQQANQMGAVPNVDYQSQQANRMADVQNVSYQQQQANRMADVQNVNYQQQQANRMADVQNVNYEQQQANQMDTAQTDYRPDLTAFQFGPTRDVSAQNVQAQNMQAAQSSYGQGPLEQFRMAGPQKFGQAQASEYMSPYMQNVVETQKREATRDARRGQVAQDLGSARQGTYGGSRQLLASLERERNLGTQLGDIQARGSQAAYENAQQQFERDRAAGLTTGQQNLSAALQQQQLGVQTGTQMALANLSNEQQARVNNQAMNFQAQGMNADNALRAALANQGVDVTRAQANLQSQLSTQELGANIGMQTSLANLAASQQANAQNLAARQQTQGLNAQQAMQAQLANQQAGLTTGQANLAASQQTQGLNAQQAMQAMLANQQAGLTTGQANLAASQQTQGLNAQQAMQAMLANQQAGLTTGQANLAASQQTQGLNAQQAMQAALANQQAGLTTGQANLAASQQTQGLNAQQAMQAQLANQSAGLEGQRLTEQSRQFGAQQGLANLGLAAQTGQTLSNIGTAQSQTDQARFAQQTSTAAQQQARNQQMLDIAYEDFMRRQNFPAEQRQQFSNMLRGIGITPNTTTTSYSPSASIGSQLMSGGLGAAALYNTASRAGVL